MKTSRLSQWSSYEPANAVAGVDWKQSLVDSLERSRAVMLRRRHRAPAGLPGAGLGFHQARAAQWVRAAGATYTDYVALRHS
jgi:hypothetical protein